MNNKPKIKKLDLGRLANEGVGPWDLIQNTVNQLIDAFNSLDISYLEYQRFLGNSVPKPPEQKCCDECRGHKLPHICWTCHCEDTYKPPAIVSQNDPKAALEILAEGMQRVGRTLDGKCVPGDLGYKLPQEIMGNTNSAVNSEPALSPIPPHQEGLYYCFDKGKEPDAETYNRLTNYIASQKQLWTDSMCEKVERLKLERITDDFALDETIKLLRE